MIRHRNFEISLTKYGTAFAFFYTVKTIRNILAALLLILFIWANAMASAAVVTLPKMEMTELAEKNEVDMYVSNGILHLTFDRTPTHKIEVEIFDITGKRIERVWLAKEENKKREVELTNRPDKGLYIVKVSHGQHVHAIKLQI